MRRGTGVAALAMVVATALVMPTTGRISGATAGTAPTLSNPLATFRVVHDPAGDTVTECEGTDGTYYDELGRSEGTITSTDPRLTGRYVIEQHAFINTSSHAGWVVAQAWIVDEQTGAEKFSGRIIAALQGVVIRGVMTGQTADGATLVANATAYHDPDTANPHAVTGTLGGPSPIPLDLAALTTGCS